MTKDDAERRLFELAGREQILRELLAFVRDRDNNGKLNLKLYRTDQERRWSLGDKQTMALETSCREALEEVDQERRQVATIIAMHITDDEVGDSEVGDSDD